MQSSLLLSLLTDIRNPRYLKTNSTRPSFRGVVSAQFGNRGMDDLGEIDKGRPKVCTSAVRNCCQLQVGFVVRLEYAKEAYQISL